MYECPTCGLIFGSLAAFSLHRVGVHEFTYSEGARMDPPREDGRRCLSESEIESATDKHGALLFTRNKRGRYSLASSLAWAAEKNSERLMGMSVVSGNSPGDDGSWSEDEL